MVATITEKTMTLVSILLVSLCVAEVHSGQSTNSPPIPIDQLLDLFQKLKVLFPGGLTLEEILNTMSLIPTMNEKGLKILLQGANIDTLNPSQISNVLIALKGLYNLTYWGHSQLPNGNINDLYIMLSKMDDQSLQSLFRNLNIDQLDNSQVGDVLTFVQILQKSLGVDGDNIKLPNGNTTNWLNMLSTLDAQSLQLLLKSLNIDAGSMTFLTGALSGGNPLNSMVFSPGCTADLAVLAAEVKEQKMWALKMIDAWGKPPPGILSGNTHLMGSFDQCLAVQPGKEEGTPFAATFCVAGNMDPRLGFSLGMCVPKTCTTSDVNNLTNAVLSFLPLSDLPDINHLQCHKEIEYDIAAIVAICVCCFFLGLIITATLFDMFIVSPELAKTAKPEANVHDVADKTKSELSNPSTAEIENSLHQVDTDCNNKQKPIETNGIKPGSIYKLHDKTVQPNNEMPQKYSGICARLLLSFSALANVRKLLSDCQSGKDLGALNGIRFFSIAWVILGHTYGYSFYYAVANRGMYFEEVLHRHSFTIVNSAALAVDSFFALSGILVTYMFMKEMKREKGRINWFMFYFHRFYRIIPAYMVVVMLNATLTNYMSEMPYGVAPLFDGKCCKEKWWTNLLFVNNFFQMNEMCLHWTWFLAIMMQFYVVSPILLVPLYFWKKIGGLICAICLIGVTVATALISAHYKIMAVPVGLASNNFSREYQEYYFRPYCRMGPYIVGTITGFILYRKGGKCKIKLPLNLFIWACMTAIACLVTFGIYEESIGNTMTVEIAALFNAVHRTLWAVSVSWVVFACMTGNGGYVHTFLSWGLFVPLGRLTYCVYLVHPLVISAYHMTLRQGIYGNDIGQIYLFFGNLLMSYMVAAVLNLGIEAPFMALERIILRRDKKTK